jgi:PAS domain S-box-containing protein
MLLVFAAPGRGLQPGAAALLAVSARSLALWHACIAHHGRAAARAARLQPLFAHSPQPAWIYDLASLRFLEVNDAAVAAYGYSREEFSALTVKDIRPPEDVPRLLATLAAVRAGQTADRAGEWRHRRKDGRLLWVRKTVHRVDHEGRAAELVLAEDITELRTLWERAQRMERLEHLGLLSAGIAHDLNNILTPMLMVSDLLSTAATTPQERRLLGTLQRSAGRGAELIRQLLAFARGSGGERGELQPEPIAREVAALIRETFPRQIAVRHACAPGLWPVHANGPQIHQALLNLCVNARDAMPRGGTLALTLSNQELDANAAAAIPGARVGRFVRLEVTDTGAGIPPDIQHRIWEPFFTTKADGGSGLGLATVRNVVAAHEGFITLSSAPGLGTVVHLYFPAATAPAAAAPPVPDPRPVAGPRPRGRVLVVDDEVAVREVLHATLTRLGHEVVLAQDGIEALVHLAAPHPSAWALLITDLDMPRLGGADLVALVRRRQPALPVLLIAGSPGGTPPDGPPAAGALGDAFLAKPFKLDELAAVVRTLARDTEGQTGSNDHGEHSPDR